MSRSGSRARTVTNTMPVLVDTMDDTTRGWTTVTVRPYGSGCEIISMAAEPTETGHDQVLYSHDDGVIRSIVVTAECTSREEDLISDALVAYGNEWADLCGVDRVCLHDEVFEAIHDDRCALVSYDRLAAALLVEIGALLAEHRLA